MTQTEALAPSINAEFGELLLTTYNDPAKNPVHLLFNQWWAHAPEPVKERYVARFLAEPRNEAFVAEGYYSDPIDLGALGRLPEGTLGRTYHDWIVDHDLAAAIATDYRAFHELLESQGMLDGMPDSLKYAVLRGFQTHDFQHVLTGYDASGPGEIALQAFCLSQIQFPYFGMWMSVVTTRMTFAEPDSIVPMMDAISAGWQAGRQVGNIQCERWETMLDQPLVDLRARFDIAPGGCPTPHALVS